MSNKEELFKKAKEYLSNTEEFLQEQTPIFIEQLYNWILYSNLFEISICLLIIVGFIILTTRGIRSGKFLEYSYEDFDDILNNFNAPGGVITFLGGFVMLMPLGILMENCYQLLKFYIAPKVYLLEYISSQL